MQSNARPEKPFGTNPCADGWEVICTQTGHPVTKPRSSHHSANGIAVTLNRLQASGDRKAFARALGDYGD
jgi:hypothetical protein